MKKLIIALSTGLCLGCAFTLAFADDTSSNNMSSDSSTSSTYDNSTISNPSVSNPSMSNDQQAGTVGSDSTTTSPGNTDSKMDTTTTTRKETYTSKNMSSCTDENGVTFRKGQTGFKTCRSKKDHKSNEQMGGTVDHHSSDSSTSGTSNNDMSTGSSQ